MTEMIHRSMSMSEPRADRRGWLATIDRSALGTILILFSIGLLLSMAATPSLADRIGKGEFYFVYRHLVFGGMSMLVMLTFSTLSPKTLRRLGVLGFLAAFSVVLILPIIGTDLGKGSVRWLSLGFISVQPSEFLKPGFAVFVAWLVASGKTVGGPPGRLMATGLASFIIVWLALTKDFGQATLILMCYCAIMFVAGFSWMGMAGIFVLVALGAQFAYHNSAHFSGRIDGFLDNQIEANTQMYYAANAIANGGFFGAGVGEGTVKYSLPDAHTDFVIAVAAEEYGVLMCLTIIGLFAFLIGRSFIQLMKTQDVFTRLAGTGLITLIGAQSMINLGVAARMFPTKGMTLPLISYGGSSMLAIGITLGFILALTRHRSGTSMLNQSQGGRL